MGVGPMQQCNVAPKVKATGSHTPCVSASSPEDHWQAAGHAWQSCPCPSSHSPRVSPRCPVLCRRQSQKGPSPCTWAGWNVHTGTMKSPGGLPYVLVPLRVNPGFPSYLSWLRSHLQCRRPLFKWLPTPVFLGFPCGSAGKESACNVEDLGSIPGLGTSPAEGKGYPLQYSGLENSMHCIAHGVTKSWTRLSDFHTQGKP